PIRTRSNNLLKVKNSSRSTTPNLCFARAYFFGRSALLANGIISFRCGQTKEPIEQRSSTGPSAHFLRRAPRFKLKFGEVGDPYGIFQVREHTVVAVQAIKTSVHCEEQVTRSRPVSPVGSTEFVHRAVVLDN